MTSVYGNGTGAREFSNGVPTAKTTPTVEGVINKAVDRVVVISVDAIEAASSDAVFSMSAPDKGKLSAIRLVNGATAADGTNGFAVVATNKSNSDDVLANVGFGTGAVAAAATDAYGAVAAHGVASKAVSDVSRCNKGDKILFTITRDGTAIVGKIEIEYTVASEGR